MKTDFNISLPLPYKKELSKWVHDDWENCYAYAINLRTGIPHLIPGEISGFDINLNGIYSDDELMLRFETDMNTLGIVVTPSSLDKQVTDPNSWKIVIMNVDSNKNHFYDFHFMRQDPNGTWHHKFSGEQFPTDLDIKNQKIIDPQDAYLDFNYHIVGYFVLTLKKIT